MYGEVAGSRFAKYTRRKWNGQRQPKQDIKAQYKEYINDGYSDEYFKNLNSHTQHLGVWITCFVAFLNKDKDVSDFLNLWYLQTLKYTTQDQVGFPYVCQKLNLIPYTLPNNEVHGKPHSSTMFYIKQTHGK